MRMRDGRVAAPRVVQGMDPLAATVVAGLAFSRRSARLSEPAPFPHVRVSSEDGDPLRLRLRLGDGDTYEVLPGTLGIDTTAAPIVPRAATPEGPPIVVAGPARAVTEWSGHSTVTLGAGRGDDRATVRSLQRDGSGRELLQVDVDSFGHPLLAARVVLQLCATGGSVAVAGRAARALRPYLARPLLDELTGDIGAVGEGATEVLAWLRRRARLKTLAWMLHLRELAWSSDTDWRPEIRGRARPTVSVLLMTKRPALLADNLARIAAQQFVDVEVIVGIHGGEIPEELRMAGLAAEGVEGTVLQVPRAVPLGAALNSLADRASGEYLAKWDDDDLYGPEHLADLVAAQRWSGAALVGKYNEFTHLGESGRTVWKRADGAESLSTAVAGGTFLLRRSALTAVGGFPPLSRAVDHHTRTALDDLGLPVFRTHGFGYVLVRHAAGHTWAAGDESFRRGAVAELVGLPSSLGVGNDEPAVLRLRT